MYDLGVMFKGSVLLVRNKSSVCLGLGLVSIKETHGKQGKGGATD